MSGGEWVLMRESYTGGRSPLSLFIGLGSWRMCHTSSARQRYMWGSASTTVTSSQAMSWWCMFSQSRHTRIIVCQALLCFLILSCNDRPVSPFVNRWTAVSQRRLMKTQTRVTHNHVVDETDSCNTLFFVLSHSFLCDLNILFQIFSKVQKVE